MRLFNQYEFVFTIKHQTLNVIDFLNHRTIGEHARLLQPYIERDLPEKQEQRLHRIEGETNNMTIANDNSIV